MKITYDSEVDALYIAFSDSLSVRQQEINDDVILDLSVDGTVVGVEILGATANYGRGILDVNFISIKKENNVDTLLKDRYIYPSVFHYAEDGISVKFPDLPGCLTCGDTTEEALYMAKEALSLHLYGMEEDNDQIPEPSKLTSIALKPNEQIISIEVFIPPIRNSL